MGAAPDRDRLLELPRTGLGEPHHPSTQIALDDRDLDQALALERAQIARQRRLIEAGALRQCTQGVVRSHGDLRHQAELRGRQPEIRHFPVEEVADAARGEPAVPARALIDERAGICQERFSRLPQATHRYMYLHAFVVHAMGIRWDRSPSSASMNRRTQATERAFWSTGCGRAALLGIKPGSISGSRTLRRAMRYVSASTANRTIGRRFARPMRPSSRARRLRP